MLVNYHCFMQGSYCHVIIQDLFGDPIFMQVNFLSQILLTKKGDGPKHAKRLVDIYFALFKVFVETGFIFLVICLFLCYFFCLLLVIHMLFSFFPFYLLFLCVILYFSFKENKSFVLYLIVSYSFT